MSYQVIARKWRPQTFADVVGQQHVTRTLSNAVQSGRVAHAYIFSGARGVGKTTTARVLAKALNCVKGPAAEPCNECDSCREIGLGSSLDVIEIDAASNRGIDQIRELREMVRYAPAGGRYKVVILDEAHMLTDEASNALLKTLEEPPDKVIFVMATTEPESLAETIRSRSQHFHFRALSFAEIVDALEQICVKENLTAEPGALAVMARAAEGSLRDALSLLEQARAYCGANITDTQVRELLGVVPEEILEELTGAIEARSAERVLTLVHRLLAEGQNLQHFCREAIGHFRNLLVARVCGADSALIAAPADQRPRLKQVAESFSEEDLTRFFQILLHTDDDLRHKPDARLHLEMGLLRLVNAARLAPLEEILADLEGGPTERKPGAASQSPVRSSAPAAFAATASPSLTQSVPQVPASAKMPPGAIPRPEIAAPPVTPPVTRPLVKPVLTDDVNVISERTSSSPGPVPGPPPSMIARTAEAGAGLEAAQVDSIKAAILSQEKFLGELIEHASRWEMSGGEVRLFFPTESRALAEMLQARDPMERLRNITSRILGQTVRVCVKLEAVPGLGVGTRSSSGTRELRAKFEQDPIVRAMLERFGGQISDVKRRSED
ncbi:MAG: polymerase tau subunit [Candidatus Acidoferrum typicum]|nr:polymerase tau subunit [Candidatus Acidoferrum typicum]